MRQVPGYLLWLGHVGDTRDLSRVLSTGFEAIVDVAANEPALSSLPRDLAYCRFPLVDGSGNPPWMLKAAIRTVANLIEEEVPTLVYCSAGMSRSPAIAAAAMALVKRHSLADALKELQGESGCDVSAALLVDVEQAIGELQFR